MTTLLTIGHFARQSGLTHKALRLYAALGLLRPALTDVSNGFRYYSADQLPLAQRIKQLRAAETPLRTIQALLETSDAHEARALLAEQRAWLLERIVAQQRALAELDCLDQEYARSAKEQRMASESQPQRCSFCAKTAPDVEQMIAGPDNAIICNECIALCNQILADGRRREVSAPATA
jgi:DNA-binding transcriptional MerR regulator